MAGETMCLCNVETNPFGMHDRPDIFVDCYMLLQIVCCYNKCLVVEDLGSNWVLWISEKRNIHVHILMRTRTWEGQVPNFQNQTSMLWKCCIMKIQCIEP